MSEDPLPERVEATRDFFVRSGAWFVLSRNSPATSCRDAAARRHRLGAEGIPLHDELKSACVVLYRQGGRRHALLHCRASRRLDMEAAAKVLRAERPLAKLATDELGNRYLSGYGTVNPFSEAARFVQVFDTEVLERLLVPYTMMTNSGEHTWAVEFDPTESVEALRSVTEVHVADIALGGTTKTRVPTIGILTGNGPESGQALWWHVNSAVRAAALAQGRQPGDLTYPRVLIHSEPEMGLSMELPERESQVWHVVSRSVDQLCEGGANLIAIACNTTQWYGDRIRERCVAHGAEFVSMSDVAISHVRESGMRDLTVIGIPVVADLGNYSAYAPLRSLGVHPVDESARAHLQRLGYQVKQLALGEKSSQPLNTLRHVLHVGVKTENVLVALTEISVLLQRFPRFARRLGGCRLIDPLKLYGDEIARRFLEALPS